MFNLHGQKSKQKLMVQSDPNTICDLINCNKIGTESRTADFYCNKIILQPQKGKLTSNLINCPRNV